MASNFIFTDSNNVTYDFSDVFIKKEYFVDGTLLTWGYNYSGQLGLGDTSNRSYPTQVGSLTDWKQVSCGDSHGAAIKTDGTLWTWGKNGDYQLGLVDATNRSSPVQVGLLTDWMQVSCGFIHTAAIKRDGTLWTWGTNEYGIDIDGILGLGDIIDRSSPTQVGSLTDWKQVSCNDTHTAAIKTDGTLWTWGYNDIGQLGLDDTIHRSSPVQVGSLTDWKQVACGSSHTAAIKTDGTLWTWGYNFRGQLGSGTGGFDDAKSSPIQVGSLTNWKQVSCSQSGTAAIKTDGTLWTWGYNGYGDLGLGDTIDRSSPCQVGSLTNWKQVDHVSAIKIDGTLWTWGNNGFGESGLGDTIHRSSPSQVGTSTNWKQVSCNSNNIIALTYLDW